MFLNADWAGQILGLKQLEVLARCQAVYNQTHNDLFRDYIYSPVINEAILAIQNSQRPYAMSKQMQ